MGLEKCQLEVAVYIVELDIEISIRRYQVSGNSVIGRRGTR